MSFVIVIAVLSFFIINPFIKAILASVIISYMAYPLYVFIQRWIKNKSIASLIVTLIVTMIIIAPLVFAFKIVSTETYSLYLFSMQKLTSGEILDFSCDEEGVVCDSIKKIKDILSQPKVQYQLRDIVARTTSWFKGFIEDFIISLPTRILMFFVMIYTMYFLLKEGVPLANKVRKLIPFNNRYQKHIFQKSKDVTFAVVYGHLFVALVQGALAGLGFFLFGVSSPIVWGIVMAFAALIPFIGTPIIWLPAALFKILNGLATTNNHLVWQGVLLILYGTLIVGTIDNILKPKIIGDKAKVHPILVLLGVLGGLKVFGIIGLVIGPVILALANMIIRIYEEEKGLLKNEVKS